MATFTASAKIYSTKYFCNTKGTLAGLGKIFVQRKSLAIQYVLSVSPLTHTYNYTHLPN